MAHYVVAAALLSVAIVAGSFIAGGRYSAQSFSDGNILILDRLTGSAQWCTLTFCSPIDRG